MKYIPKTLYLPTGGYDYSPVAFINNLDMSYMFFYADETLVDSSFDFIQSIVGHFCDLPVPIQDLYICDLYYIYSYIQTSEIFKDNIFVKNVICNSCQKENKISFFIGNFDINIFNPFKRNNLIRNFVSSTNDIEIKYRIRKVKDNIAFGNLCVQEESSYDQLNYFEYLKWFCLHQTDEVYFYGEKIDKENWFDTFSSLLLKDLFKLYEEMVNLNKSLGIYDKLRYTCKNCKTLNTLWFYDDMFESKFIIHKKHHQDVLENLIKYLISQSRLPCFNITDVTDRPIKFDDSYNKILKNTKFQQGAVMF